MADNLVIVESPAKAKTIKKYLGKDFEVLASYGHVRDLVPKEGAVDPDKHFAMNYQSIERNEKHVDAIARALKKSKNLYLATDPDREGEAISWHLRELLQERGELKGKEVKRVVFYEITKGEVQRAVAEPRDLSLDLVNAQQARRALDYLVGFNLSPLLWKKVRRGLSAGRVQSPALRMICEREHEISHLQAAGILDARSRRRAQHPDLPAQAGGIRRPESRAVQLHQRRRPRAASSNPSRMRRRVSCTSSPSTASSAGAIPHRRSPPRRCSRKPRASSATPPSAPCASRSSFMKAWTSAKAASVSSPTCAPTR